jgi:hypothetical protein
VSKSAVDEGVQKLFVVRGEEDDSATVFRRTCLSACEMLLILGAAEQALATLWDVLESACDGQSLRTALAERLGGERDVVAETGN